MEKRRASVYRLVKACFLRPCDTLLLHRANGCQVICSVRGAGRVTGQGMGFGISCFALRTGAVSGDKVDTSFAVPRQPWREA